MKVFVDVLELDGNVHFDISPILGRNFRSLVRQNRDKELTDKWKKVTGKRKRISRYVTVHSEIGDLSVLKVRFLWLVGFLQDL